MALEAEKLATLIWYVLTVHAEQARSPEMAFRRWDAGAATVRTPFGVHPILVAMMLLHETAVPEPLRADGAQALLLHDLIEDTHGSLPPGTSPEVERLVLDMTFESSAQEMEMIWARSPEIHLLKLFDKISNVMDMTWAAPATRAHYHAYTLRLAESVEDQFGMLNVVRIARALCAPSAEP